MRDAERTLQRIRLQCITKPGNLAKYAPPVNFP
jgi:hypothetical protein